jgi:alkylhydroperoxidase family enzyme
MRYFRSASVEVYEAIRSELDGVWNYPNASTKTSTAITPGADAPTDKEGRVYLLASHEECEYPAIAERLPALLSSGEVEEISVAEFMSHFPSPF